MSTTKTRRWPRWLFRAAVTAEAAFALAQAVLAGGFLAGHYDFLDLHKENATRTGITAVVLGLCAILLWRPGRGPWWPIPVCFGLFGVEALQIVLGYGRVLLVHIPLGVAIITGIFFLLAWAWRKPAGETS
jgi:chromate transport protein ChrA